MSQIELIHLIENGWSFVALFAWVWFLFMAAFVPLWMLLLLRRLSRIGRALDGGDWRRERAPNDAPATEHRQADIAPRQSLGHQLLR